MNAPISLWERRPRAQDAALAGIRSRAERAADAYWYAHEWRTDAQRRGREIPLDDYPARRVANDEWWEGCCALRVSEDVYWQERNAYMEVWRNDPDWQPTTVGDVLAGPLPFGPYKRRGRPRYRRHEANSGRARFEGLLGAPLHVSPHTNPYDLLAPAP